MFIWIFSSRSEYDWLETTSEQIWLARFEDRHPPQQTVACHISVIYILSITTRQNFNLS